MKIDKTNRILTNTDSYCTNIADSTRK